MAASLPPGDGISTEGNSCPVCMTGEMLGQTQPWIGTPPLGTRTSPHAPHSPGRGLPYQPSLGIARPALLPHSHACPDLSPSTGPGTVVLA